MMSKYQFQIIADGTAYETVMEKTFSLHAVTFRDKREDPYAPDALNDYYAFQDPDPVYYDDKAEYVAKCKEKKGARYQWKEDVLAALGMETGQVSYTGSEFFTALEIQEVT